MMQFPADVRFSDAKWITVTDSKTSRSQNFRAQSVSKGGQMFTFALTTTHLDFDQMSRLFTFKAMQRGMLSAFELVLPKLSYTRGQQVTNPRVKTTALAGSTQVSLRALKGSTQGAVLTGDFLVFANHTKAYLFTADLDSSASGLGTGHIYPPLLEDVPADTEVFVNGVPFTVSFNKNTQEGNYKASRPKQRIKISVEEKFR